MAPQVEVEWRRDLPAEQHDDQDKASEGDAAAAAAAAGGATRGTSTWWVNGAFVVFVHLVGIMAPWIHVPTGPSILILTLTLSFLSSLGITAGYHRLWSHRAFKATDPLRILLAVLGTLGFQGSIKWWVLRHRLHHRFTDTVDDPYTIKKGALFAHIGWIFEKPEYRKMKLIDASDLNADWVVAFQHRHYVPLALGLGFGLPVLAGLALGDVLGAVLYAGFWTRLLVWHATFCINSLAHMIGDREYAWDITAAGGLLVSLITSGEGYHNFHHAFPVDYRNGIRWFDYDPTKWFIAASSLLGLASDLKRSDDEEIERARIEGMQHSLDQRRKLLNWGPNEDELPLVEEEEFKERARREGLEQFILDGFVIDALKFKGNHPGGEKILRGFYGKDASKAFHGGLNFHTSAATHLARKYRIAKVLPAPSLKPKDD